MANTKIPSELVAINAISGTLIADNAITSVHIAENNITAVQIAINAVTALQMADGTITSAKIADGTIVTADIADGQITTGKLADSSVTTGKIAAGTIASADIANNAILTQHVDDNQITADQIADNAVGVDQLAGITRGSVLTGNAAGNPSLLALGAANTLLQSDGTDLVFAPLQSGIDDNSNAVAITIDSSENVLIGKTNSGFSAAGIALRGDVADFIRSENCSINVNRLSNNGDQIRFHQAGTLIGSIGSEGGDSLYIQSDGTGGGGLRFHNNGGITPLRNGATIHNTIDLGTSTRAFKDLHLSGTANVGGTNINGVLELISNNSGFPTSGMVLNQNNFVYLRGGSNGLIMGKAGDNEAMRIDSSGKVGIGTSTPYSKLNTQGTSASTYTGAGPGDIIRASQSTAGAWIASDFDGAFAYMGLDNSTTGKFAAYNYATSTEMNIILGQNRMYIKNNGNVGIGTTNPANPLSISVQAHGLYSQHRPSNTNGVGQEMYYKFNTADGTPEIFSSIYSEIESNANGAESGKIALRAAKAGNLTTGLILIGSTGNVGIGTSAPGAKLEISGKDDSGASDLLRLQFDNSPGDTGITFTDINSTVKNRITMDSTDTADLRISSGTKIHLYGGTTNGTSSPHLTVSNNGMIGIGTTSPAVALEIGQNNSSASVGYIRLRGHNTVEGNIYKDATYSIHMDTNSNNGPIRIDGSKQILGITGNVGIGTENPTAKLHVEGTFTVRSSSSSVFNDTNNAENVRMLVSGSHFNADQIDKDFIVSSDTITNALYVDGASGRVGIAGATTASAAGSLQVYDTADQNCGITNQTTTGSHYYNVANMHTGSSGNRYWHIKTNFTSSNSIMFIARVHGYSYGNGGAIVDISRSGYAYGGGEQMTGSIVKNNGSSTDTLDFYYASDSKIVFRHTTPSTGYYNGYSFDIKFQSPTGYNWNFEVVDHVMNTTAGEHF